MNVAALGDGANVLLGGVFLVEEKEGVDFETRGRPGGDGEAEGDGGVEVGSGRANGVGDVAFEYDGGGVVGAKAPDVPGGDFGGVVEVDGAGL